MSVSPYPASSNTRNMAYVWQWIAHQGGTSNDWGAEANSNGPNLADKRMSSSIDTTWSSDSPMNKEWVLTIAGLPLSMKKESGISWFENHPLLKPGMGLKGLNVNQNKVNALDSLAYAPILGGNSKAWSNNTSMDIKHDLHWKEKKAILDHINWKYRANNQSFR